jgi:hypothetical protein
MPRPKGKRRPAYPRPGSGTEDFPARRPGTKIGETRRGESVKQSTRASQARKAQKSRPLSGKPYAPGENRGWVERRHESYERGRRARLRATREGIKLKPRKPGDSGPIKRAPGPSRLKPVAKRGSLSRGPRGRR